MSNKVTLTDLLTAIGSENIRYQDLMKNMENIKSKRGETVISFVTDATSPGDFVTGVGPKGLILWVDDDVFKRRFDELKTGSSLTYEKILDQRNELLAALEAVTGGLEASTKPECLSRIYKIADDAITKAKGGEA